MKFKFLLLVAITVLFSACDTVNEPKNTMSVSNDNVSVPVDARIMATTNSGNQLSVDVIIDINTGAQNTVPLNITSINTANSSVNGNLSINLSDGSHTFTLIYKLSKPGNATLTNINVARSETATANVTSGVLTDVVIGNNLTYPDDDSDSYTNLDEFIAGTNPFDNGSHPVPTNISVSAVAHDYVLSTINNRGMQLSARLLVDNVEHQLQNVQINSNSKVVTGNITLPLATGSYTFEVIFELSSGSNTYPIFGQAVDQAITGSQNNLVDYQFIPYYFDSDGDGVTTLDELLAGFDPNDPNSTPASVVSVASTSNPTLPTGLKVSCLVDPNQTTAASSCPVLTYKGLTFWVYSFIDNRNSFAIVAYNSANQIVQQWEKTGVRYLYSIQLDLYANTATFIGQSNQSVSMTWAEMDVSANTTFKPLANQYYYLQSVYSAELNECLFSNDNVGAVHTAYCAADLGQAWKFIDQGNGYYQLQSQSAAGLATPLCLESNEWIAGNTYDGASFMAACGNFSGEMWKILPSDSGDPHLFKLTSSFVEAKSQCLESNRSDRNVVSYNSYMDSCQNVTGQQLYVRLY